MNNIITLYNLNKLTSFFAILLILILYTAIKAPYFDQNFTGEHPMKYSAYVEPAMYMVENKNPTHYQKSYFADPIENPTGQEETLPQFPILEWKLASTFQVFSNFSIEQNTRLVMHMIGVFILIFSFLFIKEFANQKIAFLFSLLLATNPIFGLATFVTVYDSLILLFLFLSLYLLTLYLKKRQPLSLLTLSGLVVGLGISAKITLLLWILPIIFVIILFKSPNKFTKLFDITVLLLFTSIPYIATIYTIPTMGQNTLQNLTVLGLFFVFTILLTKILQKQKEKFIIYLELLHKHKFLTPIIILATIPIVLFSIQIMYDPFLREEFLTDTRLLFNTEMYIYMARQFVRHLGIPLTILSVAGLFTLKFINERNIKILTLAFFTSGIIFLLTSAKSIFFHDYYTVFLMVIALLLASTTIYFVTERIKHFGVSVLLFVLIFFFILLPRIYSTQERYDTHQEKFDQALEYFIENTNENDFHIDEVQATYFSLYSQRPRIGDLDMLNNEDFKKSIRENGFKKTMDMYNIKYLITLNEEPEYEKYANIFSEDSLKRTSYRRTDLILSIVRSEDYEYFQDLEERERIIEQYKIKEKFLLEKEIGDFKFFTFRD